MSTISKRLAGLQDMDSGEMKDEPTSQERKLAKSKRRRRRKRIKSPEASTKLTWMVATLGTDVKPEPRPPLPRCPRRTLSLTLHIPSSLESSLQHEVLYVFEKANILHSWYAFVPSYIGHCHHLDSAASALVKGYTAPGCGDEEYLSAVRQLQDKLDDSDNTLLTVALLCLYESAFKRKVSPAISHRRGITAIASSRGAWSSKTSDVARAVFYANWTQDLRACVAQGIASPFEEAEWLLAGPAYRTEGLLPDVAKLRGLAQKMYIRLPRLIASARDLRNEGIDRGNLDSATTFAIQLNDLRDEEAESNLLHRVHVYQTRSYESAPMVPFSLAFKTMDEFNAALLYWGARLMVVNLCAFLTGMEKESGRLWTSTPGAHYGKLEEHRQRMTSNILMSWEFTYENGLTLGSPAMTQAVLAVWFALKEEKVFNGIRIEEVRTWLVKVFALAAKGWPAKCEFDESMLEDMSEVFVGGPISDGLCGICD